MIVEPLAWSCSPIEALERWPRTWPLAAIMPGGGDATARWSILGAAARWEEIPHDLSAEATLARLRTIADGVAGAHAGRVRSAINEDLPPFCAGWIGFLAYELGVAIEPTARGRGEVDRRFPLAGGWRCSAAAIHDALHDRWSWCSAPQSRVSPPTLAPIDGPRAHAELDPIRARRQPGEFASLVARTIELIRAGDLFQANIAQRFDATLRGDSRALAVVALRESRARHGAVIELPDGAAIISMSPELFLHSRCGLVTTRPIKGTRPQGADRRELLANEKESAELHMIVDLMRNDLARVCSAGSVRVRAPRRIESHCGVEHAVAEVEGVLREDAKPSDLLRATFPPGSVTGAPKVRAMQVIESLESLPRGPYCGAVGFIGDDGDLELNVAIRTLCLADGVVSCSTGSGIVADSNPAQEEAESLLKLEPFRRVAASLSQREVVDGAAAPRP